MPRLPQARPGSTLEVSGRVLPFSFFPVTRGARRYGLYDTVFATNPWAVMRGSINSGVAQPAEHSEAVAFLQQAEDFYRAATAGVSTNPLLLYYAFLNLAKALIRVRGFTGSLDQAKHGLSDVTAPNGAELRDSDVVVKDRSSTGINVYPELIERLGFPRPAHNIAWPLVELLPQVVVGHRAWREAAAGHTERFFDLKEIEIACDRGAKQVWLRLYLSRGDLRRYHVTHAQLLSEGHLGPAFGEVGIDGTGREGSLICLEQVIPLTYSGRPTDVVPDLVSLARPLLWRIVSAVPGSSYRRYYVHLTPPGATVRASQLEALWMVLYYLGSVVRYRPHLFDGILAGSYGAFVVEFVTAQSDQLLYLLASEMCQREIARPAIV
jgi:hypothetical protein